MKLLQNRKRKINFILYILFRKFSYRIFFTLFSMKYTTNLIACFALYLAVTSSQINVCYLVFELNIFIINDLDIG